jgi:hypothetical protein
MDELKSFAGTGGYLQSTQDNMGYGTASPGMLDPSYGGYGVYVGDEAYSRQAIDRVRRNVAESRAAMLEAEAYDKQMYDYAEARRQRPMKEQQADWAHEEKQMQLEDKRMQMENARARFRAENPLLADAAEKADLDARINRERRQRQEAQMSRPIMAMITELYEDGEVSPETIAEYNASIKDNPNRAPITAFGKDPMTGELYSVTEDGQRYPFQSIGALDAWRRFHPESADWALSSYPIQVREQKIAEEERERIRAKDDLANAKMQIDYAEKERKAHVDMMQQYLKNLQEDIKNAEKFIADGAYQSEDERLAIEKQLANDRAEYKDLLRKSRTWWDPDYRYVPNNGRGNAEQEKVVNAANKASASGVSLNSAPARSYKEKQSEPAQ